MAAKLDQALKLMQIPEQTHVAFADDFETDPLTPAETKRSPLTSHIMRQVGTPCMRNHCMLTLAAVQD